MNRLAIIVIALLALAGSATAFSIYNSKDNVVIKGGKVLHLVEGYKYVEPGQNTCQALIPECGYCPGEVINKSCYTEEDTN